MGCCFSRASGPNSPYPGGLPNPSARHINPPPLTLPESVIGQRSTAQHRSHRSPRPALTEQLNKPLRRHKWTAKDRSWTREQLKSERRDYFDTRVTGRPEIWQTLKAVLEILWSEDSISGDGSDNLLTAQTMLSAAEISLPTGDLADGAYDSFGNYYALPEWVVAEPQNLADSSEGVRNDASFQGEPDSTVAFAKSDSGEPSDAQANALTTENQAQVRARLSETGKDIVFYIRKSDSVQSIVEKIGKQCRVSRPNAMTDLVY
ncbi:hypothetical protein VHEMI07855 [[Torrubiella] hemipterigena]|uniref:DC-UbP/UBTD2 N-terminal domain-containing protein n=1 Tax=[Torrubiella] hemipterigena TaxID=1531966 RepID=A0A0A1TMH6_9HYPO|nr:hypothetical protein VHEMI07855 [[Torrubiella] hemipterigena]